MKRVAILMSLLCLFVILAATPAFAAQSTPTATVTAKADGTRKDPIPRGQSAEVGDWTVQISGYRQNANEIVAAENMFNDPPAEGAQFAMVTVKLTYNGTEIGSLFEIDFKAVGESNVAYTTYENTCGVVPNDPYSVSDIFPGGSVKVNYCWAIKSSDAKSLLIYVSGLFAFDEDPIFFKPSKDS